jgi:hypothetical protein
MQQLHTWMLCFADQLIIKLGNCSEYLLHAEGELLDPQMLTGVRRLLLTLQCTQASCLHQHSLQPAALTASHHRAPISALQPLHMHNDVVLSELQVLY